MRQNLFRQKKIIAAMLIMLVVVLYHTTPLKNLINAPQRATTSAGSAFFSGGLSIRNIWLGITQGSSLLHERDMLEEKLTDARIKIVELESLARSSKALDDIQSRAIQNVQMIPARVLLLSKQEGALTALINAGSNQGVRTDYAVMARDGVFYGKIISVTSNTATALIATDGSATVAATLSDEPTAQSIVTGRFGVDFTMTLIPQDSEIAEGDIVTTSSLEKNTPPGLILGTVTDVHYNEGELFKSADVAPAIHYEHIETVAVLAPRAEE